ncbi:hypothetical protein TKWG_17325 [Advenella kashmirensis WT001]|uniref:Uncharacterized protein n=1 Tax=Advenella kashmirensis (strain DSM 17095 / LMG 22695 / WT001) TaxID=1036672 RepID=I3UED2_ADVKW|nr:hypothetical protein TKWG_17325 [Advenella kashmirensis WT001]
MQTQVQHVCLSFAIDCAGAGVGRFISLAIGRTPNAAPDDSGTEAVIADAWNGKIDRRQSGVWASAAKHSGRMLHFQAMQV